METIRKLQLKVDGERIHPCLLVTVTLIVATLQPMTGSASETAAAEQAVSVTGKTYLAWRIWVPLTGGEIAVSLEGVPLGSTMVARGFWLWKAGELSSTRLGAWGWTIFGETRASFHSKLTGNSLVDANPNLNCDLLQAPLVPCGYTFNENRFQVQGPAEWVVLVEAAPDGAFNGTARIRIPSGGTILGTSQGPLFLDREVDFRGELNVHLEPGPGPIALRWMENVSTRRDVGAQFFGFFRGRSDADTLQMGYDGPQGSVDGARFYLFEDSSPGDYSFRVDYAMETDWRSQIAVMGGAIELP